MISGHDLPKTDIKVKKIMRMFYGKQHSTKIKQFKLKFYQINEDLSGNRTYKHINKRINV